MKLKAGKGTGDIWEWNQKDLMMTGYKNSTREREWFVSRSRGFHIGCFKDRELLFPFLSADEAPGLVHCIFSIYVHDKFLGVLSSFFAIRPVWGTMLAHPSRSS